MAHRASILTAALLIACLFISACGYSIMGFDSSRRVRFYIERVIDESHDADYGYYLQSYADEYFIKFGEKTSYENATYFLQMKLEKVDFEADITNATNESASTTMTIDLLIIVTDANGVEVFSKDYKNRTETFSMSGVVSATINARRKALESIAEDIFDAFRSSFNRKVLK